MSPDLLEGAVIAVGAFLAGQWLPRPHRRRGLSKPAKPPQSVCGCSHHHSFHDPQTGECHGMMKGKPVQYDAYGYPTAHDKVRCTCRTYSGPVPLPEYVAQELGG